VLVVLCVSVIWSLPWRRLRMALVVATGAISVLNFAAKADVNGTLARAAIVDVPTVGPTPLKSGTSYIEQYVVSAFEVAAPPSGDPLPPSQRGWLDAYRQIADRIVGPTGRHGPAPAVLMTADEPLLNNNDVALAAQLDRHQTLSVQLAQDPSEPQQEGWYEALLQKLPPPSVLVSVNRPARDYQVVAGREPIASPTLLRAARALGFRRLGSVELPDGRRVTISRRLAQGAHGARPQSR
jgi:hypothetical protein